MEECKMCSIKLNLLVLLKLMINTFYLTIIGGAINNLNTLPMFRELANIECGSTLDLYLNILVAIMGWVAIIYIAMLLVFNAKNYRDWKSGKRQAKKCGLLNPLC